MALRSKFSTFYLKRDFNTFPVTEDMKGGPNDFSNKRVGEKRGCVGSCCGNRREGDHWGDLGVDGRIILGWISRRWDVGIWTGLGWPRIEAVGGRL